MIGRAHGAGLTITEMVSADGLVRRNRKTLDLLAIGEDEHPVAVQLFGSDPAVLAEAVGLLSRLAAERRAWGAAGGAADLIDINAGCPVKKVVRTGAGASLLDDPGRLYRIVRSCAAHSPFPVTVKMRLGLREDSINLAENGVAAQEAGAALLTLHARTASAGYGGNARWEFIGALKEAVDIPVCGNGDIRSPGDAVRMILETGCDAVMVGRAAVGNPWLLGAVTGALRLHPREHTVEEPSPEERLAQAEEHLRGAIALKGEERAVKEMKRHLHRYVRGIPGAASFRESLFRAQSAAEMREIMDRLRAP